MKFWYRDLGQQKAGTVVEVSVSGNAANVRLLDSSNFSNFKAGRRHRAIGGHVTRSPVRLQIPNSGHWYVTLDFGGSVGNSRWGVQILPGALPPMRQVSASSIAPLVQGSQPHIDEAERPAPKEYDVFISHASEDKETIARPLAHALRELELRVWYDEFELRLGDRLRRTIDKGLVNSRFGVVVLSHSFFAKNWPQYELDGLVTREMTGEQVILPLWHNISKSEIMKISPSLVDKIARSTADFTIEEIANEIADVINNPRQS